MNMKMRLMMTSIPLLNNLPSLAHHGLEENHFDENEDAFKSDYQSDSKPSRRHTSLEEKRIDLEMLKEKNRNLELWHAMKRARTFSGPEESSISTGSRCKAATGAGITC